MTGHGKVDTEKPTVPKKPYTRAAARNPNNPNSPDNGVGSPQLLFDSHGVPTNLLANRQGIDLVANPGIAPYIAIPSNKLPFGQQDPGSIGYDKREALIAQETLKRKQQEDVAMQDEGAQRRPPPAKPQFLLPTGSNAVGWGDGGPSTIEETQNAAALKEKGKNKALTGNWADAMEEDDAQAEADHHVAVWDLATGNIHDIVEKNELPVKDIPDSQGPVPRADPAYAATFAQVRQIGYLLGEIATAIDDYEAYAPCAEDSVGHRLQYELNTGFHMKTGITTATWYKQMVDVLGTHNEAHKDHPMDDFLGVNPTQRSIEHLTTLVTQNLQTITQCLDNLERGTPRQPSAQEDGLEASIHAPRTNLTPGKTNPNKGKGPATRPTDQAPTGLKSYAKAAAAGPKPNKNNIKATTTGPKRDVRALSANVAKERLAKKNRILSFKMNPLPADLTQVKAYAIVRQLFKANNLKASQLVRVNWNQRNRLVIVVNSAMNDQNLGTSLADSLQTAYRMAADPQTTVTYHPALEGFEIVIPAIPIHNPMMGQPFTLDELTDELKESNDVFEKYNIITKPKFMAKPELMQQLLATPNATSPLLIMVNKPLTAYDDFFRTGRRQMRFYGYVRLIEEPKVRRKTPQCQKCWAYMHSTLTCTHRMRCVKCGGYDHTVEQCQLKCQNCANPAMCTHAAKCANCKGDHRMDYVHCPGRPNAPWSRQPQK